MGTDTAAGAGLDAEPSAMLPGIAAMAVAAAAGPEPRS